MFFFKWFASSHLKDPPSDTLTIMDMPGLVIWKVLKNIDLISVMNLRKVNRAFQHFIDETKLLEIDLQVMGVAIKGEHKIELALGGPAKWVNNWKPLDFCFEEFDGICTVNLYGCNYRQTCKVNDLSFLDQFEIFVDGILNNLKTPLFSIKFETYQAYTKKSIPKLSIFQSIFECVKPKKPDEFETFEYGKLAGDEFLNEINRGFHRILKPMTSRKLQIQNLDISYFTLEQAIRLISSIQPEILEDPKVDQIWNSEGMKKAERCYLILDLKTVDSDGTVISNGYIRRLGVRVQKLTTPDLLFWKKIILATPHLRSIDFYFKEVSSYEVLTSVLGPATKNDPDIWFLKGSQKHLKLIIYGKYASAYWIEDWNEPHGELVNFWILFEI